MAPPLLERWYDPHQQLLLFISLHTVNTGKSNMKRGSDWLRAVIGAGGLVQGSEVTWSVHLSLYLGSAAPPGGGCSAGRCSKHLQGDERQKVTVPDLKGSSQCF